MRDRIYAILAGNHREYVYFCKEQGWPVDNNVLIRSGERLRTVHCDCTERMRGYMPDEFFRTGTWYTRPQELIDEFAIFRDLTEAKRGSIQRKIRDDVDNRSTGC